MTKMFNSQPFINYAIDERAGANGGDFFSSNEAIKALEDEEKSILLMFCNSIAGISDKSELSKVVSNGLKYFFNIEGYLLSVINEDHVTYNHIIYDLPLELTQSENFRNNFAESFIIEGGPAEVILNSLGPVTFYKNNRFKQGVQNYTTDPVLQAMVKGEFSGVPLRIGTKNFGILWTYPGKVNERLLPIISLQISAALANILANEKIEHQAAEIQDLKNKLKVDNSNSQQEIETVDNDFEIIGTSDSMEKVFQMVSQVSQTQSTVLLLGETGTGKELIAKAIHHASLRKDQIMVTVNCAALPANLIESELFGHEKGSFTGAIERRIGKWELAHHGTLFLDEIGEMPLDLQVKILRALQEKEIERVGGKTVIKTDVRVIAATNRNLQKEVQEGSFRKDLFFRLNVFPIVIPPLRERKQDILALASYFLKKYAKKSGRKITGISSKVMWELSAYHWPGNVRELEHLIERSILLTFKPIINQLHLPTVEEHNSDSILSGTRIKTIDEIEREHIMLVLKSCEGRIAGPGGAAQALKIPPTTLNSKIKRLGIRKEHMIK